MLVTLIGCTRRAAPSDPGPGDVAATPVPTDDAPQDTAMIDLVRDLVHHVTAAAPTVDDLVSHLGATRPDSPADPIAIVPRDDRLTSARVSPGPDGKPYLVDLRLARPIPVRALSDAFGPYTVSRRADVLMPWPLVFSSAGAGAAVDVAVIADVAAPRDELDDGSVDAVTLRLDWKE